MQSLKDEIAQLQASIAELEVIVEQQKAEIATLQQKVIIIIARTRLMAVDSAVLAQQSGRSSQQASEHPPREQPEGQVAFRSGCG